MKKSEQSDGAKSRVDRHLMETHKPRLPHRGRYAATPGKTFAHPDFLNRHVYLIFFLAPE